MIADAKVGWAELISVEEFDDESIDERTEFFEDVERE